MLRTSADARPPGDERGNPPPGGLLSWHACRPWNVLHLVLRHHEGRSLEEICAALSLNVSAAKQAIFRAVRKLRAALEAPGELI